MTLRPLWIAPRAASELLTVVGALIALAGELVLRAGHVVTRAGYWVADHNESNSVPVGRGRRRSTRTR